jgi:TolB-like protein
MADRVEPGNLDNPAEATAGPARRVFISYASHDAPEAQQVCLALETAGFPCWIAPRNVVPGTLYAEGIVRAINESTILVLILSEHSAASAHVGKELERASSKRHPIIALRTDTAPLPPAFEYFLSESQWIDVGAGGTRAAITSLVGSVRQHLLSGTTATALTPSLAVTAVKRPAATPRRTWVIAGIIALALAAAYIFANKVWQQGYSTSANRIGAGTSETVGDKSIAVLPFTDLSEKKDQEYFADGIAEEVLDRLAKVPGLKVVGRVSSFQFKGKNADPASIGAALGVAYLLEGSVRKEAGRVRVAAQLVDARTGSQRWSDHFESDVIDVLRVQDTIAAEIARALQIAVEADTAPRASVKSLEALDAYLRGLHSRGTREGAEAAVADFQKALALDPTFAPAAIGLADSYVSIGSEAWLPTRIAFERAREAALLAQRLDPKSPAPHVSMASIHIIYDWDWSGADRELQQALALGPRETGGVLAASQLAAARGQWDEARQLAIEGVELDPLNPSGHIILGWNIYLHTGQFAEAEQSFRRALQIAPENGSGQYFLGEALMLQGHQEEALAEFRKETLDDGRLEGSAMAHFVAGRQTESDAALAEAIRHNGTSWPSEIARVYAFRDEKDRAFDWLEKAYNTRDEDLYIIKDDPLFKNLEGDPRYKTFLRKMNLPE